MLRVENISYRLQKNILTGISESVTILENISFTIEKGKIHGIAGESGCGKTTLAKILVDIIKPTTGKIIIEERKSLQLLFQNNGELLNPYRTVDSIISDALLLKSKSKKDIKSRKEKLLSLLNIDFQLLQSTGGRLSGGEQQRIALARILAVEPEIVILDEPFSAQDAESQLNLVKLFKKINKELSITLICITHDINLLQGFADNLIVMKEGKIVEQGDASEIFAKPKNPYTKLLFDSAHFIG